jgi:hypothetical protein
VRRGCVWATAAAAASEAVARQRRDVLSREFKVSPSRPEKGISAQGKAEVLSVGGGILEQAGAVCPAKSPGTEEVATTVTVVNQVLTLR